MQRKGLSTVVTTVLIILLVVTSVIALGTYVTRLVGQGGRTVSGTTLCLTNTVEPVSCILSGGFGNYTATVITQRKTDSLNTTSVRATYFFINSTVSLNRSVTLTRFSSSLGSMSELLFGFTQQLPSVFIATDYLLSTQDRFSCTSKTVTCTIPDCVTSVQATCQSRSACLWLPAIATGCSGTATSCAGLSSLSACTTQEGCTANTDYRSCTGGAFTCDTFTDKTSCNAQAGCWANVQNCTRLDDESCSATPGCSLPTFDCHTYDDDPDACTADSLCSWNDPSCDGEYLMSGCDGSYFGGCEGSATSCDTINFGSPGECNAQQGCSAYEDFISCEGLASSCASYTLPPSCTAQAGCSWVIGRSAQCLAR